MAPTEQQRGDKNYCDPIEHLSPDASGCSEQRTYSLGTAQSKKSRPDTHNPRSTLILDYLIEQFQEAGEILFAGPGITFPSSTHASGAEPSVP